MGAPASEPWTIRQRTDRPGGGWRVGLAILLIALLYLAGVTNRWWPTPDSALYLSLGRSLTAGEGYVFNGQPHNTVAPGLPLLLAWSQHLLGAQYWVPNLLMCLSGLAAIIIVGQVFALASDRSFGWAVAILTAGSYAFYLSAHRILSDAPFFLLFWLVIYASLQAGSGGWRWLVLTGLLSIAAVFVRVPGFAALGILAVALLVQWRWANESPRPRTAALVILLTLSATAGGLLAMARAASSTTPAYTRVLTLLRQQHLHGYLEHFQRAMADLPAETASLFTGQSFAPFGYALLLLAVIGSVLLWLRGQRLWVVMWILYPPAVAMLAGSGSIRVRYLLPIYPAMAYAALVGVEVVVAGMRVLLERLRPVSGPSGAAKVFVAVLLLFNAPKIVRNGFWFSYLSHTDRFYEVIEHGRYAGLPGLTEAIRLGVPPAKKVAARADESIIHLLTGRIVVPYETPPPRVADLTWVPADAVAIVLVLPDERGIAAACRRLAASPSLGLSLIFTGEHYEAYSIARPGGATQPTTAKTASD